MISEQKQNNNYFAQEVEFMAIIRIPGQMDYDIMYDKMKLKRDQRKVEAVFPSSQSRTYHEDQEETANAPYKRVRDEDEFHRQLDEAYHRLSRR